jgi:hypothetical protein
MRRYMASPRTMYQVSMKLLMLTKLQKRMVKRHLLLNHWIWERLVMIQKFLDSLVKWFLQSMLKKDLLSHMPIMVMPTGILLLKADAIINITRSQTLEKEEWTRMSTDLLKKQFLLSTQE